MELTFREMDLLAAIEIVGWEYPPPYELYSMGNSPLALVKLIGGGYFSVFWQTELFGFFCYGQQAQLKTKGGHKLYQDQSYLDVGLGMHPDYCSSGFGVSFVQAGLEYARKRLWPWGFRLTVASNNLRALTVYQRVGFRKIGEIVWDRNITATFHVLTLDSLEQPPEVNLSG